MSQTRDHIRSVIQSRKWAADWHELMMFVDTTWSQETGAKWQSFAQSDTLRYDATDDLHWKTDRQAAGL